MRGHGKQLFDESIHVPLVVLPPGRTMPGDIDRLVSSVDIAPTVLELAGIAVPSRFAGRSFAAELDSGWRARLRHTLRRLSGGGPVEASYSENLLLPADVPGLPHERALVVDDLKVIEWRDGASRFYDLAHDPREQAPNSVDDASRAYLETSLAEAEAGAQRDPSTAETRVPDERTRDALKALGYVQ